MSTDSKFTKAQLARILSTLTGARRKPANSSAAIKAIDKAAAELSLTKHDVLDAAPGLLDGRLSPETWLAELKTEGGLLEAPFMEVTGAPEGAEDAPEAVPAGEAAPATEAARAGGKRRRTREAEGASPKAPRETKTGRLIALLERPEGATVEEIAAATGWQHHSIRGAIADSLKKKMGLTVTTERVREVGPNKVGAKGSTTTYRIVRQGKAQRAALPEDQER
jgi:Protein of unknown function (DUF3489)